MPATQADNLIEYDPNKYVLRILKVKKYDKSLLKKVSRICSCNILEAKRIIEDTGKEFKPMDLYPEFQSSSWYISDIDEFTTRSKDPYDITPEYKW